MERVETGLAGEELRQLSRRVEAQLDRSGRQLQLYGPLPEEKPLRDLARRATLGCGERDLELPGRQPLGHARPWRGRIPPRHEDAMPGALGPRLSPQPLERRQRPTQQPKGVLEAAVLGQSGAVQELGPRSLERSGRLLADGERLGEGGLVLTLVGQETPAAGRGRERRGPPCSLSVEIEAIERLSGIRGAVGERVGLDQVRAAMRRPGRVGPSLQILQAACVLEAWDRGLRAPAPQLEQTARDRRSIESRAAPEPPPFWRPVAKSRRFQTILPV